MIVIYCYRRKTVVTLMVGHLSAKVKVKFLDRLQSHYMYISYPVLVPTDAQ